MPPHNHPAPTPARPLSRGRRKLQRRRRVSTKRGTERGAFEEEERGRVVGRDKEPRMAERGAAFFAGEVVAQRTRDLVRGVGARARVGGVWAWARAWARAGHTSVPCPVM